MSAGASESTRVQLCGRLSIEIGGVQRVERLRGRQVRLLLAYLLLNRSRHIGREELIGALWTGPAPASEDAALRTLLSRLRSGLGATYHYTLGFTIDAVLVAVFIVQMLQLHSSALWSWLESPVARYLGVISYPLYLWHQWGLSAGHHVQVAGPLGELVAGIGGSILLASGSYYVIERPFLGLKARFAAATAAPAPGRRAAGTVEAPA